MKPTFEDLLHAVRGRFNLFQLCLCLFGSCVSIASCMCIVLPLFILTIPNHRCALDGWENDTYRVQNSYHEKLINTSIPVDKDGRMSSCTIYRHKDVNASACQKWVYDNSLFDRSLIQELDLVCDHKHVRIWGNVLMMVGRLAGAPLPGIISDRLGRKISVTFCVICLVVGNWSAAFIYDIPSMYLLRFIAGFGVAQVDLAVFVLVVEFLEAKHRRYYNSLVSFVWGGGGFIMLATGYFVRDFQHLSYAIAVPTSLLLIFLWFLPESPRWLLSKGRRLQAREIMRRVARVNGVEFPEEMFSSMAAAFAWSESDRIINPPEMDKAEATEGCEHSTQLVSGSSGQEEPLAKNTTETSFFQLFKYKSLCARLLILMMCWLAFKIPYTALLYNVSNLGGSLYFNFGIFTCVELTGAFLAYLSMDRMGRSVTYLGLLLLTTVACLSTVLPVLLASPEVTAICVKVLSMVGVVGLCGGYLVIVVYSAELVPTLHRNAAISVFDTLGRMGGVLGSFIADLGMVVRGQFQLVLPLLVSGLIALVAFILAWHLPETKGAPLPNTTSEARNLKHNKRLDIVLNRRKKQDIL